MRAIAAVQLPAQSNAVVTIPPFTMPGKAQCFLWNETVLSRPFSIRWLFRCNPSDDDGPQPKHSEEGVYAAWIGSSSPSSMGIPSSALG
jgi:hypothetical protein